MIARDRPHERLLARAWAGARYGPPTTSTIVVVAGGDPVAAEDLGPAPAGALVVAADSGIEQALRLGLTVDLAVGDFDSTSAQALDALVARGAAVERHPEAKDATDLELALAAAAARGARRVLVVGGHGGRLDHFLANAALLAADRWAGVEATDVEVTAQMGPARLTVVRRRALLQGEPGGLVSLLPAHGPAEGVVTEGLLYPLRGEDLPPGSTRGVSNQLTAPTAEVRLRRGVLLAVQPGRQGAG